VVRKVIQYGEETLCGGDYAFVLFILNREKSNE